MIVDSSALVAIALREAGHDLLIDKLSAATQAGIGAPIQYLADLASRETWPPW